jgi:diguanylate cyclase (GGDEF)-like protein
VFHPCVCIYSCHTFCQEIWPEYENPFIDVQALFGFKESDFNLFHTAITLENQVRRRTVELEEALLKRKLGENVETTVEHHCTSSIGVVLFVDHDASQEDILKWADMAMYQAKQDGRNTTRFFDGHCC